MQFFHLCCSWRLVDCQQQHGIYCTALQAGREILKNHKLVVFMDILFFSGSSLLHIPHQQLFKIIKEVQLGCGSEEDYLALTAIL